MKDHSLVPPRHRTIWKRYNRSPLVGITVLAIQIIAWRQITLIILMTAAAAHFAAFGVMFARVLRHFRTIEQDLNLGRGRCPKCGYVLTNQESLQCPECGCSVTRVEAMLIDRRYRRIWGREEPAEFTAAWRRIIGRPFGLFPTLDWSVYVFGFIVFAMLAVLVILVPTILIALALIAIVLGVVITYSLTNEMCARPHRLRPKAKQVASANLKLNPDWLAPATLKSSIETLRGTMPKHADGVESLWLEYGPLPWHIVEVVPGRPKVRSVLPAE